MAKSLVQFRGNGFWLSNGVLQVLLHYAAADLQLTPDSPSWMNNLVAHWLRQAQIPGGYLVPELDEHLTDQQRIDAVLAALDRLRKRFERAPNGVVSKETLKAAGIGGRGTYWLRDADAKVYVRALGALRDLLVGRMNTPVATAPVLRLVRKP